MPLYIFTSNNVCLCVCVCVFFFISFALILKVVYSFSLHVKYAIQYVFTESSQSFVCSKRRREQSSSKQ